MVKLFEKIACLTLQTAGLTIGCLGAVGSFLGCIISAICIAYSCEIAFWWSAYGSDGVLNTTENLRLIIVLCSSFYFGVSSIHGVVSGLLIFGTKKKRHSKILPWLIFHGICVVFNALSLQYFAYKTYTWELRIYYCIALLVFALYFYIYLGIFSLYKQIQMDNDTTHCMVQIVAPMEEQPPPYPGYAEV